MPSPTTTRAVALALIAQLAACTGEAALQPGPQNVNTSSTGGGGTPTTTTGTGGGTGGGAITSSTGGGAATTGTGGGTATTPACTRGGPLASSIRRTALTATADFGTPAHFTELPTGAALAFSSGGAVQLRFLDANDALTGTSFSVPGDTVLGLAAGPDELGLLVSRAPDKLVFVRVSLSGAVTEEQTLLTGGDHTVIGTEWFGEFARTGRLVKTPTGYAAYAALHRRWPDNIGHQGDTLKLITPDAGWQNVWDWGCSHSGDQRLHHNGSSLGAMCQSDCYPQKAIMFNHRQTLISDEPSGNCVGGYGGELGGLTSDADAGFMLTYASREGRDDWDVALVHLGNTGQVLSRAWLTADAGDDRQPHLARFDGQLLAGWTTGQSSKLKRLPAGPIETIPHALGDDGSDWQSLKNGDVAWVQRTGNGTLEVIRVRACP